MPRPLVVQRTGLVLGIGADERGPARGSGQRPAEPPRTARPDGSGAPGKQRPHRCAAGGWRAWSRCAEARAGSPARPRTAAPRGPPSTASGSFPVSSSVTRPRTRRRCSRAAGASSSGSSIRLARGWRKASYSAAISGRKTGSSGRRDHAISCSRKCSSCWPICARSQTSGLIRGECWRASSASSNAVSASVRSRAASSSLQCVHDVGGGDHGGPRRQLSSAAVRQASGPSRRARSRTRSAGVRPESSSAAQSSTAGRSVAGTAGKAACTTPRAAAASCRIRDAEPGGVGGAAQGRLGGFGGAGQPRPDHRGRRR
jgi:hypothetical protein